MVIIEYLRSHEFVDGILRNVHEKIYYVRRTRVSQLITILYIYINIRLL